MPRPKVLQESRQRIAKACLYCQMAKQKCDGHIPCAQCQKRGKSNTCAYSAHERSYGRRRREVETGHVAIHSLGSRMPPRSDDVDKRASRMTDVAIPKLPHNLYDTKGRVLYLGHCAALSFLQNIQELIETEVVTDVGSFTVYEEAPPVRDENTQLYNTTNIREMKELVNVFFASTCGIIDIFGRHYLDGLLNRWASGSLEANSGSLAILYLAMAYAAQARCATVMDIHRAQSFHDRGRQIALLELTNDPSLETAQAFILISLYMLGCSRRNGAYFNLGIAISAAKSLGLHRNETNADFPESEARLRKRVWRTLRYHDLFFCAMMGRTSAIITTDSTVLDEQPLVSNSYYPDFPQELGLQESCRAFSFLERTVNEVYTKQTVPLGLLQRMSQELQEASSKVPIELRTVPAPNCLTESSRVSRQYVLRNASVACNYYFSMMLLTRPFLITSLRAKRSHAMTTALKSDGKANPADTKIYADITHGATSSIDSATKTIQLLHELMIADMLFNNMPLVVAWAFVAALTVCSAYFGRLGVLEEYECSIQQADEILQHFARNNPQARRYCLILRKLSKSALDYIRRSDIRGQDTQNTLMPELFRWNPAQPTSNNDRSPITSSTHLLGHEIKQGPISHINYLQAPQRKRSQGDSLEMNNGSSGIGSTNGAFNQANIPTMGDGESLLDLAQTFHDLNNAPLDMFPDPISGCVNHHMIDFENTDSIWDLNWGEAIL